MMTQLLRLSNVRHIPWKSGMNHLKSRKLTIRQLFRRRILAANLSGTSESISLSFLYELADPPTHAIAITMAPTQGAQDHDLALKKRQMKWVKAEVAPTATAVVKANPEYRQTTRRHSVIMLIKGTKSALLITWKGKSYPSSTLKWCVIMVHSWMPSTKSTSRQAMQTRSIHLLNKSYHHWRPKRSTETILPNGATQLGRTDCSTVQNNLLI